MPKGRVERMELRVQAALTLAWVMATHDIYADADNTEDTDRDFTDTGGNEDREWMARKFVPDRDIYISTVTVVLGTTGTPAGSVYCEIYTDDGDSPSLPSALLSGSGPSDLITIDDITEDAAGESITFRWTTDCPLVKADTTYWVVMKTTGYDYTDTTTELRWRTDADGATGLYEVAKYDANATPAWTTSGADEGADLTVGAAKTVHLGDCNSLVLYGDFVKGSAAQLDIKIEFSMDGADWYQQTHSAASDGVITDTLATHKWAVSGSYRLSPIDVCDTYARASVKALTDATGAEASLVAVYGYR